MRALPSTCPAVAQGSHKGASPLDPPSSLETVVLVRRKGKFWVFPWDFSADFDCFKRDFSAVFQWNFRAENKRKWQRANAPDCAKFNNLQQKTRVLPSTRPAVAQGSHKGASPLDPCRPPQTVTPWGRKFYVEQICNFMIISKRR